MAREPSNDEAKALYKALQIYIPAIPTKNEVEEFCERIAEEWEATRNQSQANRWKRAAIAWALQKYLPQMVGKRRAGQMIKEFRRMAKVPASRWSRLVKTWEVFGDEDKRFPHLSFTYHELAAHSQNPLSWLLLADERGWSTDRLRQEIREAEGGKSKKVQDPVVHWEEQVTLFIDAYLQKMEGKELVPDEGRSWQFSKMFLHWLVRTGQWRVVSNLRQLVNAIWGKRKELEKIANFGLVGETPSGEGEKGREKMGQAVGETPTA